MQQRARKVQPRPRNDDQLPKRRREAHTAMQPRLSLKPSTDSKEKSTGTT